MGTPPLATAPHYDDDPTTPRPWHRRPVVIVAAMVVVVLVIATVTWWGLHRDDNDSAAPTSPPPAANTPPPVSNGQQGYLADTVDRFGQRIRVPQNPAGLALPQVSSRSPRGLNDPAQGVQWQQIYRYGSAPFSTSDGPGAIGSDGLARQIARTPQGSVIAANQIMIRAYYGPPEVRKAVMEQQAIGPDTAKQFILDLGEFPARQFPVNRFVRVDGQYSDTFSRVSLASGPTASADYPSGQYYSVSTLTMVWDDGQWKWRIPDDGFTAATGDTRIESVAGWTQW